MEIFWNAARIVALVLFGGITANDRS